MKRFKSEFVHSYKTYSFGYCEYAAVEHGDTLSDVYAEGFLPYSGSPNVSHTCYMARSARVPLTDFTLSSENRRILRQFEGQFVRSITPLSEFNVHDEAFRNFCLLYFAQRHGEHVMPAPRLDTILSAGFITHIATYTRDGAPVAYVFLADDTEISHFWFSFYDLALAYKSLGMWLMLDAAIAAKENGKKYFYMGTVYGEKALYKTNFEPIEFWNGDTWVRDAKQLRALSRNDEMHVHDTFDRWKEEHEHF